MKNTINGFYILAAFNERKHTQLYDLHNRENSAKARIFKKSGKG